MISTSDGMRRGARLLLVMVLLVICADLRLTALRLTDQVPPAVRADSAQYFFYTINLHRYGIYSLHDSLYDGPPRAPDVMRPPGLPLLAQPIAADAEQLVPRFLLAQALVSIAAGLLVFWMAHRLAGFAAGALALGLYALSPHLVNANLYFLTEAPMTLLLIGFAAVALRAVQARSDARWWLLAGALLGFASLTRPFTEGFVLVFALFACRVAASHRWPAAAAVIAGAAVWLLPWHVFSALHDVPGSPSLMVGTIHHGLYPGMMFDGRPETFGFPYHFDPRTPEIGRDLNSVLHELLRRFAEHPWEQLRWFLFGKPAMLWQWSLVQGTREIFIYPPLITPFDFLPQFSLAWALSRALHYPVLLLAVFTCIAAWVPRLCLRMHPVHRNFLRLMGLLFAWTTAIHMVGAPISRYHLPLKPLLFVVAAIGAIAVYHEVRRAVARSKPAAS